MAASAQSTSPKPIYSIRAIVEHGDERGRLLGFPTANVPADAVGLDGVYAGAVTLFRTTTPERYTAAVSVGHRPTFYDRTGLRLLEAHLLDFEGDLYGMAVLVELHVRVRPQRRFVGANELIAQLHDDVAVVRAWSDGARLPSQVRTRNYWGPRGPVGPKVPRDRTRVAEERNRRRMTAVASAVKRLAVDGKANHESVAQITGLPLPYLLWRFPTTESLLLMADQHQAGPNERSA